MHGLKLVPNCAQHAFSGWRVVHMLCASLHRDPEHTDAPQVAKDPESGITHYICIIVAYNLGKASVKGADTAGPVPLPKLPVNLDDVPTARWVLHSRLVLHASQLDTSALNLRQQRPMVLPPVGSDLLDPRSTLFNASNAHIDAAAC